MRQAFVDDLEYLKTNVDTLPEFIRETIIKGPDFSKPNVAYWILCLRNLVSYYKHDVKNLANLTKRLDSKNTDRDSRYTLSKFQTIASKVKIKVSEREAAIIACSQRLERDLK